MMTLSIVALTVLISFLCFNDQRLFNKLAFKPYMMVHQGEWFRFITHGFVHADWMHLFVNMITFYSFGRFVEQYVFASLGFSNWAFIGLYFGGMIAASIFDLFKYKDNSYYTSIGASGAVSAVLFAAIFFNPWENIYLLFAIPIPGIVFGFLYLFYCQYMAKRQSDNINHNAHFYGAVYGFIFPLFLDPQLIHHFLGELIPR